MIQRIQTVFLVLALMCAVLLFFFPFWQAGAGYSSAGMDSIGAGTHIFLMPVAALIVLSHLITIFLFKKRKRQLYFCTGNILLFIIFILLTLFLLQTEQQVFQNFTIREFKAGAYLPFAGIILNFLARRSIQKDEALIRSMNRLR